MEYQWYNINIFFFYHIENNDINDMPLEMKLRMVQELEVEDSGMLRESAYINVNILREMRAKDLPIMTNSWWRKVHNGINNSMII